MKNFKKFWKSPALTVGLFIVAAALLLAGGIGGARAALTYTSEQYRTNVSLQSIGVSLEENGNQVSYRNYASDGQWNEETGTLLADLDADSFKLGKAYDEKITVTNSGNIDEFVRVIVYKYWLDADGNKLRTLSPDLIELNLVEGSGWVVDEEASTDERTVLYYTSALGVGETSPALSDKLTISNELTSKSTETESYTTDDEGNVIKTITTTYEYDGVSFQLEAEVDAVQTHNAQDAIRSAWGRNVSADGTSLSLN